METIPPYLIIPGAVIIFALFWFGVVWLIAQMSGWPKLAEKYPARQLWNETCWSLQSALVRWAQYRGILRVCADAEGVHFSVIFPFSVSQQPFSVPWTEVTGHKKRISFIYGVELHFQQVPSVTIKISTRLADNLVEASSGAWKYGQSE